MLAEIIANIFDGDGGDFALSEQQRLFIWGLFARGIALVLCVSFTSLSFQVVPLAGKNGVSPFHRLLNAVRADFPAPKRYFKLPTVFWLTGTSDLALRVVILAGFVSAFSALLGGTYSPIFYTLTWVLYLSLNNCVGLMFPWDAFLLEASFLCTFFAPLPSLYVDSDSCRNESPVSMDTLPHPLHQWLFRWLLARLMLGFGKLKFLGTNSKHHCYIKGFLIGQPMPTKIGWLGYHMPLWFHKFSLVIMFVVEIMMPPLLFSSSYLRTVAGISFMALMIGIQLTGNFGYFNLLTAVVSIQSLDVDSALTWNDVFSKNPLNDFWSCVAHGSLASVNDWRNLFISVLHIFLAVGGTGYFVFNSWCSNSWMDWPVVAHMQGALGHLVDVYRFFSPFKIINSYGVFPPTSSPPVRWVVILEGSDDQDQAEDSWKEFHWRFMTSGPGDHPECAPRFVAPHHPRLDHSLFYTAVGMDNSNYLATVTLGFPYRFSPQASMCHRLATRILQGGDDYRAMFACFFSSCSPFPDPENPPKAIRATMYAYRPVTLSTWWASGCSRWYDRKKVGEHMAPMTLDDVVSDSFWIPPAELFHADSTVAWKRWMPSLSNMPKASTSAEVAVMHGSAPERCGGILVAEKDVSNTFWNNWINGVFEHALVEGRDGARLLKAISKRGSMVPVFVHYAKETKSQFSFRERRILDLILGRLSHRLIISWLELYFQEDGINCTKEQGREFHRRLKRSLGIPPSFIVLEMLAHFVILNGRTAEKYNEALGNPIDAAMAAAEKITTNSSLLMQISLRLDTFIYHGRKFIIAKSFSMDGGKDTTGANGDDESKIPLLPGFLHLKNWLCSDEVQHSLGIENDQKLPRFKRPEEGGEWEVFWDEY